MKTTLTKKEIKNAPKYVVRVDLKSSMNYTYGILESTDLLSAMLEAEEGYHNDEAYLLDIFEKTDAVNNEMNTILYKSTVRARTAGSWHACDRDHCESPCAIQYDPRWNSYDYADYEMISA